jgi:hypothetical protein
MKVATVFALLLVSANAFTAPQFATRAVGPAKKAAPVKAAPAKKVVAKKAAPAPKVVAKKAAPAPKKVVAKKVAPAPKKVVAKKPIITKIKAAKVRESSTVVTPSVPGNRFVLGVLVPTLFEKRHLIVSPFDCTLLSRWNPWFVVD